jgi:hypothetical protein
VLRLVAVSGCASGVAPADALAGGAQGVASGTGVDGAPAGSALAGGWGEVDCMR